MTDGKDDANVVGSELGKTDGTSLASSLGS